MLPSAELAHSAYGRTRLRFPSEKGNAEFFSRLKGLLEEFPGIDTVEIKPLTSSVILFHRDDIQQLERFAEERQLFHLVRVESRRTGIAHFTMEEVDVRLKRFTGGDLDLPGLTFLVLLSLAIVQLIRGDILPAAFGLFASAFEVLIHSRVI